MATTISLSASGLTTLNLDDGTHYRLRYGTWAPSVPPRRVSVLGGRGIYEDVDEQMTLDVLGTSAADALANLANLSYMLDQSSRWYNEEENVNPVILSYQPDGSTQSAALQTLVIGRVGDEPLFSLDAKFNDVEHMYEIPEVTIKFRRRGIWIGATESVTGSTSNSGDVNTLTFPTTATVSSPVRVGFGSSVGTLGSGAVILVAPTAAQLKAIDAKNMTGTAYTSVSDTGAQARGTNVLRYTPTGTTAAQSGSYSSSFTSKRFAVYATVRNNSATTTFQIRVNANPGIGGTIFSTPYTLIDTSTTSPRTVFLGFIGNPQGTTAAWTVTIIASAASGTLDIDEMVFLDMDNETSRAVGIYATVLGQPEIAVDPAPLTSPIPKVGSPNTTAGQPITALTAFQGDAYLLSKGNTIATMLLATSGTSWRYYSSGTITITPRASRQLAYVAPQ